jgi:hypothetical protein
MMALLRVEIPLVVAVLGLSRLMVYKLLVLALPVAMAPDTQL